MTSVSVSSQQQQTLGLQKALGRLSPHQQAILRAAQVSSPEDLYALLHNFPSLSRLDFDLPALSFAAVSSISPEYRASLANAGEEAQATPAFGAYPPAEASAQIGFEVPEPPPDQTESSQNETGLPWPPIAGTGATATGPTLDLRPGHLFWPIRDQGRRGTCVAFALAACREFLGFEDGEEPSNFDLSEQLLYWATKLVPGEPNPNRDGTFLAFASRALERNGVCLEASWPYNGTPNPGNVTQQNPPTIPAPAAVAEALNYASPAHLFSAGGTATALRSALESERRPVAISVPVFSDLLVPGSNNWNTPLAYAFGKIIDPPATSIVRSGHAVCVTGFVEDSSEIHGGYFTFRNSWGTAIFGRSLPATGYFGPEAGYGQISATYVEKYLWEMCQL